MATSVGKVLRICISYFWEYKWWEWGQRILLHIQISSLDALTPN